jgi:hypothetical protein
MYNYYFTSPHGPKEGDIALQSNKKTTQFENPSQMWLLKTINFPLFTMDGLNVQKGYLICYYT